MHQNSELLFKKYAQAHINSGMRVLEIGPDGFPSSYQQAIHDSSVLWDTIDIYDSDLLTFQAASEYMFPIPNNQYDVVISGQVIEHVSKIWLWMQEVARVVKPGGLVITINPVSWPYHDYPIDCWRIYPDGMRALYEHAGLDVLVSQWESLETPTYRKKPGRSLHTRSRRSQIIWNILGKLGAKVEAAYDTVTIGIKK